MPNSLSAAETGPLLTIAIPTYNRASELRGLLECLENQGFDSMSEVEVIVADNASADDTEAVVAAVAQAGGLKIRYHRHAENIGANANFAFCYHSARGRYFWLFGDDDLILPGTVEDLLTHLRAGEFDLIYVTSYGFREDWKAERKSDPFNRRYHTISSARTFTRVVNMMFTFISGIIVNKQRLESLPHEDPETFVNTHLIQLGWTLPLLRQHRRSLVLWNRPVAGRQGNTGLYSLSDIFGTSLVTVSNCCLPDRPDLARMLANFSVRRFFPPFIVEYRLHGEKYDIQKDYATLKRLHGRNFRFWLFLWPAFKLPLPLARLWTKAGSLIGKIIYMLTVPGFWRKQT